MPSLSVADVISPFPGTLIVTDVPFASFGTLTVIVVSPTFIGSIVGRCVLLVAGGVTGFALNSAVYVAATFGTFVGISGFHLSNEYPMSPSVLGFVISSNDTSTYVLTSNTLVPFKLPFDPAANVILAYPAGTGVFSGSVTGIILSNTFTGRFTSILEPSGYLTFTIPV